MECHSERFKIIRKPSSVLNLNTNSTNSTTTPPAGLCSCSSSIYSGLPQCDVHHQQQQTQAQGQSQNKNYREEPFHHLDYQVVLDKEKEALRAEYEKGISKKLNDIWNGGKETWSALKKRNPFKKAEEEEEESEAAGALPPSTESEVKFPQSVHKREKSEDIYSSDEEVEEEWSDGEGEEGLKQVLDNAIEDDEIPLVRLYDSVTHFASLYRINSPAFTQQLYSKWCNWVLPPVPSSQELALAPNKKEEEEKVSRRGNRKKRPSWLEKGVHYLKRWEFNRRMSRVAGDSHKQWVLNVALLSRLLIFLLQLFATNLLSILKHNNDGFKFIPEESYGKYFDPLVNATLGGYVNWDAHYFLHISVYGYTSENIMAFFPLLPMALYIPSRIAFALFYWCISLSSIVIIAGVIFNTWLFLECTGNIYELAKLWSGGSPEFVTTACLMFSFNPASIFFTGLYTETLFAYLTSQLILSMFERKYWISFLCSGISGLCRSNGVLNVGFILALQLQREILKNGFGFHLTKFIGYCVLMLVISLIPFWRFQAYGIRKFCDETIDYEPNMVPSYCLHSSLWLWNMPYFYIQKTYWSVGFLGYFQLKQIPNFILAFPSLYCLGTKSWCTLKSSVIQMADEWNIKRFYHTAQAIHGLFLTLFCFCFVHVQVSTRMIMSACPYLYAFVAQSHVLELETFRKGEISLPKESLAITLWCMLYFIFGSIAFSLGLPWT